MWVSTVRRDKVEGGGLPDENSIVLENFNRLEVDF